MALASVILIIIFSRIVFKKGKKCGEEWGVAKKIMSVAVSFFCYLMLLAMIDRMFPDLITHDMGYLFFFVPAFLFGLFLGGIVKGRADTKFIRIL
jgi:hypothetical protein